MNKMMDGRTVTSVRREQAHNDPAEGAGDGRQLMRVEGGRKKAGWEKQRCKRWEHSSS